MKLDKYSRCIFSAEDAFDSIYKTQKNKSTYLITSTEDYTNANNLLGYEALVNYNELDISIQEFDKKQQEEWFMPKYYKDLDIAAYILDLCKTQEELERCGEELLLYQDKNLFNLLRYLLYLVNTMTQHKIIWGVGRGSSVSSYVLFKLRVHRINSITYNLDVKEFLR